MIEKRGKGHEERDVLSESGRGKQLRTDRWKTIGANIKGLKSVGNDHGEDRKEQVK